MNDRDQSTDVWAEVIAAVEFLRDGLCPGITVWEVLNEAIRQWLPADGERGGSGSWTDPDPLRTAFEMLLREVGSAGGYGAVQVSSLFTAALRDWLDGVRRAHNDGQSFSRYVTVWHEGNPRD